MALPWNSMGHAPEQHPGSALWVMHGALTRWLLWGWMGIDHWGIHGMVLWVMHWGSIDLHWGWPLRIPWTCFMDKSLGCPHGTPMELHGPCTIGAPWKCLKGNAWRTPHVASMGLDGDWSLGFPWDGSMGNALGSHGLCIGTAHWEFHGSAQWVGHGDAHL